MTPPERTASIACISCLNSSQPLFRAAAGAFKNDVRAVAPGEIADSRDGIIMRGIDDVICSQLARHSARFLARCRR